MAEQQMPLLKVSVLHYRDQSHDEETWIKWYLEEQIPRFIPLAHKYGIDRCELVKPPSFNDPSRVDVPHLFFFPFTYPAVPPIHHAHGLQTAVPSRPGYPQGRMRAGWNMAPYDAATIYWVRDPQKIRNMLNDPDWEGKVVVFEKGWINQNTVDVQVGTQTTFIEDGKIVNTVTKEYPA